MVLQVTTRVPVVYSTFDWDQIGDDRLRQTRLMAAGFASNMLTYRDEDSNWRQHSPSLGTISSSIQVTHGLATVSSWSFANGFTSSVIGRQENYLPVEELFVENQIPDLTVRCCLMNNRANNACCIDFCVTSMGKLKMNAKMQVVIL